WPAIAQEVPPKQEFRGAWIATVINLDWPLNPVEPTDVKKRRMEILLDGLQAAGVNAVLFQIRSEADAMYVSETEPWSVWLTGSQGTPPDPFFDPLAFAIEEAHKRGMELHAWLNPFRVQRAVGSSPTSPDHISNRRPEWTFTIGGIQVLDPGIPAARDYVVDVVAEVANNYDVDGIHFDDYFYPYPPNQITNQDDDTFAEYNRGITNRGVWRRENIDLFVEAVQDTLLAINPDINYGISPFGIWKNGVPPGIVGLDAYSVIYGDAVTWLNEQTIDYLAPQLYWAFGGGQDYGKLAPWWASVANDRHLYHGLGAYRTNYSRDEIPRQIRLNRGNDDIQGQILFRALNVTGNSLSLRDSLQAEYYRHPALPPTMPWKDMTAPEAPGMLNFTWDGDEAVLNWDASVEVEGAAASRFYAVYRINAAEEPDYEAAFEDPRNLLALTDQTTYTDTPVQSANPYYYTVRAVSANSIESVRSNEVVLEGRAVDAEADQPVMARLVQNYPNPFVGRTTIAFVLDRPATVSLRVYDALGREISTLLDRADLGVGPHTAEWETSGRSLSSGTYFYMLDVDNQRQTGKMTLLR
ncbi:MAG: family 10 glycosylhydrolase, partial [Bacteroidota bacterium]